MKKLPFKLKLFIALVIILSGLLMKLLINTYDIVYDLPTIIFWSILAIITESLLIFIPGSSGGVSVGFAISLASIMIGGPLFAAIITAFGFFFRVLKIPDRGYMHLFNTPFYKTMFNVSQSIINIGISGIVYTTLGGVFGKSSFVLAFLPIIAALSIYVLLNTMIMSILISLLSNERFIDVWKKNIRGIIPNLIAVGTLGVIIALAYISYGAFAVVLFFGPLLLARYSFKLYMDMKHVYMETIQALTNAMEAKDAYTKGHADRVGKYAVKLARALNLSDKKIENIKNAAILHDIGKIGIDDQILKKPGKLTDEEYQKIKEHPSIGAEILKGVNFLKEVSNIVRHHHERYDGKGYPDGLKEDEIPVEAAILAIADVYDAMTSDRPYRKALSKDVALSEIEKNAGTQFDPEFAKMFVKVMRNEEEKEMLTNVN
ncbi:HD-GYP domain-containing protein [Caloranaerobacter ferrireducens]|uniref:HD-GYP domain-containing protein n=1 Tax=Caloranaerobacter ferrireducens TaxID=1323370 RepID=UPI00084D3BAD|nr:HD-GYP domain-containing protein [Caloranaerobacter ferrireducens]